MTPGWRSDLPEYLQENPYPLGDLFWWPERWHTELASSAAQLVNEYGWVWLWRDGSPSHLTKQVYPYYLGENATAKDRWHMQAYWLQCQTEWLRTRRDLAGILAFCYLSDNLGFTGDWWVEDVTELNPSPTLAWFQHCFAPSGVYIDVRDQRYIKIGEEYGPGSEFSFNLVGVTDKQSPVNGTVRVRLLDSQGDEQYQQTLNIKIRPHENQYVPICFELPDENGGYLLLAEFSEQGETAPVISRRYITVGNRNAAFFHNLEPKPLK